MYQEMTAKDDFLSLGLHLGQELLLLVLDLLFPGLGGELLVGPPLLGDLLLGLGLAGGVGADGGVGLLVHGLHAVGVNTELDVPGELLLVGLLILLHQVVHVVGDVLSEDVLAMDVGVELSVVAILLVEAGEALAGVGDVHAGVDGALHGSEHLGAGGGTGEADVEAGVESRLVALVLNQKVVAVNLKLAGVQLVQLVLVQQPPAEQETGAVGGGVVGESDLDSVLGQLRGIGGAHHLVALQVGVGDLTCDVLVGDPDNHAVLGGVILVLVLDDKTFAGIVVGLALAPPPELDLEPLEVSLVLDHFDKDHLDGLSLPSAWNSQDLKKTGQDLEV